MHYLSVMCNSCCQQPTKKTYHVSHFHSRSVWSYLHKCRSNHDNLQHMEMSAKDVVENLILTISRFSWHGVCLWDEGDGGVITTLLDDEWKLGDPAGDKITADNEFRELWDRVSSLASCLVYCAWSLCLTKQHNPLRSMGSNNSQTLLKDLLFPNLAWKRGSPHVVMCLNPSSKMPSY